MSVIRLLRTLLLTLVAAVVVAAPASAYKVKDKPMPNGMVGAPYTYQFEAEGGSAPHTFTKMSGGLPPGLSLSAEGAVTGTPTAAGTWSFWIQATDSYFLRSERKFTLTISPRLTITTNTLPPATVGAAYTAQISVTGGVAKTWSISGGSLPSGLTLNANGTISGTPTNETTATFTVAVSDGSKSDTHQFVLAVVQPVTVAAEALPPAVVGVQFTTKLEAAGGVGSYQYRLLSGTLPKGLGFDGATGVITGVPRTAGSYTITVGATASSGGAAQWNLRLTVIPSLTVTTTSLPRGAVGKRYASRIVLRGGVGPVAITSVTAFPPGLHLNGDTGALTGRPTKAGSYRVQVTATDSYGSSISRRFTIVVGR